MSTLTTEDKISLVDQKIRNLDYSLYSASLDILVEEASSSPDQDVLAILNSKKSDLEAKVAALNVEKTNLLSE